MPQKKYSNPRIIATSADARCAKARDCYPVYPGAREAQRKFLKAHRLFVAGMGAAGGELRAMCLVCIRVGRRLRAMFMDAVTGSMYDARTLRCLTSSGLCIGSAQPDKAGAKKLLKALKSKVTTGGYW